jgi:hypothetical protein
LATCVVVIPPPLGGAIGVAAAGVVALFVVALLVVALLVVALLVVALLVVALLVVALLVVVLVVLFVVASVAALVVAFVAAVAGGATGGATGAGVEDCAIAVPMVAKLPPAPNATAKTRGSANFLMFIAGLSGEWVDKKRTISSIFGEALISLTSGIRTEP